MRLNTATCPLKTFGSRDAVKEFMLKRQLSRRTLTDAMRVKIALGLKPIIEAKAKANKKAIGGAVPQHVAEPVDTRMEVAKAAGVSTETVRRAEAVLNSDNEEAKVAML